MRQRQVDRAADRFELQIVPVGRISERCVDCSADRARVRPARGRDPDVALDNPRRDVAGETRRDDIAANGLREQLDVVRHGDREVDGHAVRLAVAVAPFVAVVAIGPGVARVDRADDEAPAQPGGAYQHRRRIALARERVGVNRRGRALRRGGDDRSQDPAHLEGAAGAENGSQVGVVRALFARNAYGRSAPERQRSRADEGR